MSIYENEIDVSRPPFLSGGRWHLSNLNHINIVLGRNGAGKSILLRQINTELRSSTCAYIVPERTGDISFSPNLMTEIANAEKRRNRSGRNFLQDYRNEVVTRIQGYYTKRGTKSVSFLESLKHSVDDIFRALHIILPDFTIREKSEDPFYELTRIKDGSTVRTVTNLSSGESQILTLGMDILTTAGIWEIDEEVRKILLIDEPDAHIHPDLQVKFADFVNFVVNEYDIQLFIATHSMTLVSSLGQFGGDKVSLFYIYPDETNYVGSALDDVTKELSSFLGGHLVMGPLFSSPVLLVEGDDDYRVWIHAVRGGKTNVCVLPCNGDEIKKYQKTLEKMFSALSENKSLRGIALIDGDKGLPTTGPENKQDYVKFMRLNCRETENLYMTDEVLAELGHNWESAKEKILQDADKYGEKREMLKSIIGQQPRDMDLKPIMHQISQILDPKNLFWSVRIGKVLGRDRPTGMLEDFLGRELVDHLWNHSPA